MMTRSRYAKLIRRLLKLEKRDALAHGGMMPAMWLARGFIVRVQSWLDDRWGGGPWLEVVCVLPDDRMLGYVNISLRAERNGIEETHEVTRAMEDPIELLRPHIATPTQWRLRCG